MGLPDHPPIPQSSLGFLPSLPNLLLRTLAPPEVIKNLRSSVESPREIVDADGAPVVAGAEGADGTGAGAGLGGNVGGEGGAGVGGKVLGVGVVLWIWGVAFVVGYAGDVGEGVFGLGQLVAFD